MNIIALAIALLDAIKEGFHFANLKMQTSLLKDQDIKQQRTDILNATKTAIKSGDNTSILNLADQLRQPPAG